MTWTLRNGSIKVLLPIVCVVALGVWASASLRRPPIKVRTVSLSDRDVAESVQTNGVVTPQTEFQARASFPGIVDRVPVTLGEKVAAGELLVVMKDPFATSRVATAESAVSGASESYHDVVAGGSKEDRINLHADLEHALQAQSSAKHSLDLFESLQQQGAVGAGEVEQARKRLDDVSTTVAALQQRYNGRYSQFAVDAATARLADAKAALGAARISFNNANIVSPVAGTVYSVSVLPYDFAPMGAELLRVADLTRVQVRAYFDEPEVGKLKAGQSVVIRWDGRPGATWHGHITQAPVAARPQGDRSIAECIIRVDNSEGDLLPNTHVLITVSIEEHKNVPSLPREALQSVGGLNFVFRVVDGHLVRTPISLGLVNLDRFEVTQGLSRKDEVVSHAETNEPLRDGLAVRVDN